MSDYFFDGQIPSYRSSDLTKSVKIDPDNNSIVINDTISGKILNINSQQLSNNSGQSLLFSDIYTTVNKTPSITFPPTDINTLNINNTISLTDGITTNTLNQSDWTGSIKTFNTTLNAIHYLNFSDASTTGQGNPQKNANINCNPSTATITATNFTGTASNVSAINLTSDNTNGTYYIPFSKTITATQNNLFIDNVTGPLSYNPSTSSLGCLLLNGTLIQPTTQNTATYTSQTLSIMVQVIVLEIQILILVMVQIQ